MPEGLWRVDDGGRLTLEHHRLTNASLLLAMRAGCFFHTKFDDERRRVLVTEEHLTALLLELRPGIVLRRGGETDLAGLDPRDSLDKELLHDTLMEFCLSRGLALQLYKNKSLVYDMREDLREDEDYAGYLEDLVALGRILRLSLNMESGHWEAYVVIQEAVEDTSNDLAYALKLQCDEHDTSTRGDRALALHLARMEQEDLARMEQEEDMRMRMRMRRGLRA